MLENIKKIVLTTLFTFFVVGNSVSYAATDDEIISAATAAQDDLFSTAKKPPVTGNGTTTLVFFYDYNCPYSRILYKELHGIMTQKELGSDALKYRDIVNKLRIIYLPVGIIDEAASQAAAISALAAHKQGKFFELHEVYVNETKPLALTATNGKASIPEIVAMPSLGIDQAKYQKDYNDVTTEMQVLNDNALYDRMKLPGVPSIIGAKLDSNNKVIPNQLKYFSGVDRATLLSFLVSLTS